MPQPATVRTFLFSDLRDFTVFVETHGDRATAELLRAYRRIVRAEVATHAGAEIKTEGDSFYVVFESTGAAVRCSVGIVRRIRRHNELHRDRPIQVGIGINTGEAVEHDGGFVGSAVIIASRLANQATALQILISGIVHEMVRTAAIAPMRDLGAWRLKGVTESIRVFEVESAARRDTEDAIGPALRLPAMLLAPASTSPGLVVCPELVQRDAELATLLEHLAAVTTGETRFVALTGEGGIGKSRLCREIGRFANDDGFTVLGGRSHANVGVPYEPFVVALRPYAHARGTDVLRRLLGPLLVELRRMLPELEIPAAAEPSIPEEERRDRFLRTIQLLLEDAASQRPVLLVLEDLHGADEASLGLMRRLAATLRAGICIVFTFREEELGQAHPLRALLTDLERDRRIAWLRLAPLDLAGVARMTAAMLPGRDTAALAHAVFERSEGVPFYVEELLKTALVDPTVTPDALALPLTVRDSVQLRVSRLAEERGAGLRELLEAAAVAGVPLGYDALVRLSERDELDAAADVAAAVEAQLLERTATRAEIYQFRHALTREAIESDIPPPRRRRLHRRVAEVLEALPSTGPRAAMLAHHFAAAGDPVNALHYARAGAAEAESVGAYATAIQLLEDASRLATDTSDEPRVLEELAFALHVAGRAAEAADALERARRIADASGDIGLVARIDIRLASALRIQGRRAEAITAVKRAIASLETTPGAVLAEALAKLAELHWAENDAAEAARVAERAIALAERDRAEGVITSGLTILGAALTRLGRPDGIAKLEEAARRGREQGDSGALVATQLELAQAWLWRGKDDEARASADAGLAIARSAGLEFAQARLLSFLTRVHLNQGRINEARAVAEQAVALARPDTIAANAAKLALTQVLDNQGEHEAALALFDQIARYVDRLDPDRRMIFFAYRAQALLSAGRLDEAAASAAAAVDATLAIPGMGMTAFLAAADVAEARRDRSGLGSLTASFERYFTGRETAPINAVRLEMGAIADELDGRDAGASFTAVAAAYASFGAVVRATYRRASSAIADLSAPGKRPAAERRLREISAELTRIGAAKYVAVIERALKISPRARRPSRGPLVGRELRVAMLISRGLTDRRIARDLGVTDAQARALVSRVLTKLGVASRSQVASWVIDRQAVVPRETAL